MAKAFPAFTAGAAVISPAKTSTDSNQLLGVGQTITVTAAQLTLGARLGGIAVPKGAEMVAVMLDATDLDSSTGITLSVGDAADNDRFLLANTIAQTGAVPVGPTIAKTGFGYQFAEETIVGVYVAVAPSGTPADGTVKLLLQYVSN